MNNIKLNNIQNNIVNNLKLDQSIAPSYRMAQSIDSEMNESISKVFELNQQELMRKEEARRAAIQTAENTEEMKSALHQAVCNQNHYISLLEQIVDSQTIQIENQAEHIKQMCSATEALMEILDYCELSVDAQKELSDAIREELLGNHQVADYLADKGGDIAVAGINKIIPYMLNGLKVYLISKGII